MNHNGADTVRIAEFKARLSHYLKGVRNGGTLTIMDRDHPVARLVPYEKVSGRLVTRKATRKLSDIKLPPPLKLKVDSLSILLEDRKDRF
jgi:prevent-host-death family protein